VGQNNRGFRGDVSNNTVACCFGDDCVAIDRIAWFTFEQDPIASCCAARVEPTSDNAAAKDPGSVWRKILFHISCREKSIISEEKNSFHGANGNFCVLKN